jgi:acyl carrier protein
VQGSTTQGTASLAADNSPTVFVQQLGVSGDPKAALLTLLLSILSSLAGLENVSVDASLPLVEVGLTSLHAVELVASLTDTLGLQLSPTIVYECVTLQTMTARILTLLAPQFTSPSTTPTSAMIAVPPLVPPSLDQSSFRCARVEVVWNR